MGMASRALSPLVPSWFRPRHRQYAPSPFPFPEAARGTERRRPLEEQYKRLIAELRPPRSPAPPDPSEVLAYETEKRRWINEQKRLIAEAMRRSGGPDPRWDENDHGGKDDRRKRRTVVIEELSAYEIKKRRWMEQHKRSIARVTRRAAFEEAWRHRRAQPVVSTETAGDPAKRPCVTYADRFGPGSDAAFLKSVLDDQKSGGGVDRDSGRWWAERDEAHKRRQRYLRDYCPFQREEESVLEEEEKKRTEPDDDAEIEPSVPVPPANGPGSVEAEFSIKLVIQKNPPWVGRRRSEEYYAMRRQVLQSFKFVTDESEKAGAGVAPRSACTTDEEASEESVPEKRKQEEPDDAEIERTVMVLPASGPESVDAESSMTSVIEKNPRGCRRGDEGYNAMRREVLQSFKFVTDESEKADAGVAPRSPCATRRRSGMFLRSVLGFARVPPRQRLVDVVDRELDSSTDHVRFLALSCAL